MTFVCRVTWCKGSTHVVDGNLYSLCGVLMQAGCHSSRPSIGYLTGFTVELNDLEAVLQVMV